MFDHWPVWLGGLPGIATFIVVCGYVAIQWLKNRPVLEQQKINERLAIKTGYTDRMAELVKQVDDCHKESREREAELQAEIDQLKTKINNEAMQRVQSEISLVNTLIQVVDAPELKKILAALENRQIRLISLEKIEQEETERSRHSD